MTRGAGQVSMKNSKEQQQAIRYGSNYEDNKDYMGLVS